MKKKEAFRYGRERGYEAALCCELTEHQLDTMNIAEFRSVLRSEAYEAEDNSRQFAGFEFFAHEVNDENEGRSEGLWEAFDRGVAVGVERGVREQVRHRGEAPSYSWPCKEEVCQRKE